MHSFSKALELLRPGAEWASIESTYETLNWLDETQTKPTKEELEAKISEIEAVEPMRLLRKERNRLLEECDWVTWRSYSQGIPVPIEWATYQQALRDLPSNTTDPSNPVWPTKPS